MLDRTQKRVGHGREREVGDGRRGIRGEMGKPIRITCGRRGKMGKLSTDLDGM